MNVLQETNEKILTNLLVIILAITPLIIFPFNLRIPFTNYITLDFFSLPKILFIYIICILMFIFLMLQKKDNLNIYADSKGDIYEKFLTIYLLLISISTIFSSNIYISVFGNYDREDGLLSIIAFIFLFLISKRYYSFSKKHVNLILLAAFIIAICGISQYLGYDLIPDSLKGPRGRRASVTMGNPNFLGSYLVLLLPISMFNFINTGKKGYALVSSIIYLALLCTSTRGSWLGAFFSILLMTYYLIKAKYNLQKFGTLIILFFTITVSFNLYNDNALLKRFLTIPTDLEKTIQKSENYDRAGAGRIFIWERTLKIIKENPIFGVGIENLGNVFTQKFGDEIIAKRGHLFIVDKAHNEYLHIAVTTGIPSLIVYLMWLASILLLGLRKVKNNIYILPLLASIFGYAVQAFFNISVVANAYVFWCFCGIMVNFCLQRGNNTIQNIKF